MDLFHKFLDQPFAFLHDYALPFLVVLSVLVFVHEWGHFIVARMCGVKVETFSIGFGPELFGWTARNGTRWKVSLLPLGGYVQMFGDVDPTSATHEDGVKEGEKVRPFSPEERRVAFYTQPIRKRAAIVFAGPAINFLFAIIIMTGLFAILGQPYTPAIAAAVTRGDAADKAGIKPDDKIISANGQPIMKFQDLVSMVSVNLDKEMDLVVVRSLGKGKWSEKPINIHLKPKLVNETDRFGFNHAIGRIGIVSPKGAFEMKPHTLFSAFGAALDETWSISASTLKAVGQIITGVRSKDELGGILRIGAYAGEFAKQGMAALISFAALLSVNLGLINLLPIPMLDGGHLAFYALETVKGGPLSERVQEYALRAGLALLLSLMLLATWNDLVQMKVVDYVIKLVS
jgi:regulator of sigma E protease